MRLLAHIHKLLEVSSFYLLITDKQITDKLITRDGGKWWSKDHHLVVVKIVKNVDFSSKNVKKW